MGDSDCAIGEGVRVLENFVVFVGAVLSKWLVLVGGAAIITILQIVERYRGQQISWSRYAYLMLLLFFYASFLAWCDERDNAVSLQLAKTTIESHLTERDRQIDELKSKLQTAVQSRPIEVKVTGPKLPALSPLQERLLELVVQYQKRFAVTKLVIGRRTGKLFFDHEPQKATGGNILKDLYGSEDPQRASEFEKLMESMPSDYVRFLSEARFDNPFVASVTNEGMRYLRVK
jgi:hypothetical protein